MLILFYPFLKLVAWLTEQIGSESPYLSAAAIPVAISLFHTTFNIANTFLLVWFVNPIARIVEKIIPVKVEIGKTVDEPKFLSNNALKYPETAIATLLKESNYLFKNAIFEIVSHALNIHREDIKSDLKIKKVIKKSNILFETDIRELYATRIKHIYGEIIKYATKAQSTLNLNESQNSEIAEIKIANRRMVEIIKDVNELSRNITLYLNSENKYIKKEYDKLRKRLAKVLRIIYLFRTEKENQKYYKTLEKFKETAKANKLVDNLEIDNLIRKDLITIDMASSLVNDNDNVNDMIKNLIIVAELLYGKKDTILENGTKKAPSI